MSDCRNFCFQSYLREERQKIENPNINNLMQVMNIMFCGRTFTYYADMYRTMLTRVFSLVNRTVNAIMGLGEEELTLEEKEKVTIMVDGLFGILNFIIKAVYEKVVEVV